MNLEIIALIVLAISLGTFCLLIYKLSHILSPNPGSIHYVENSVFTEAELRFKKFLYRIIMGHRETLGHVDVQAQVNLSTLVKISNLSYSKADLNKITSKRVDFVLTDKKTGRTLLVIELDDKSHQRKDKQDRDAFVDKVLYQAGIPIEHIKCGGWYNEEEIYKLIFIRLRN